MPNTRTDFEYELTNLHSVVCWSKSLDGLPQFSVENIEKYVNMVTAWVFSKSTVVKKAFQWRRAIIWGTICWYWVNFHQAVIPFLLFLFFVCGASLRKQNGIFVALTKADGSVAYAYCQCPAGRVGACSQAFAVMKLVAKWVIGKTNKIPEAKACTWKPCAWSIPQCRERLEKSPISSLKIFSPMTTKSKINNYSKGSTINNTSSKNTSSITSSDKGITSSLYHAWTLSNRKNGKRGKNGKNGKLQKMHVIYSHNKNIPVLSVIDLNQEKRINTRFGTMPVGSVLSNQCRLIPPHFNIYCNLPDLKKM